MKIKNKRLAKSDGQYRIENGQRIIMLIDFFSG